MYQTKIPHYVLAVGKNTKKISNAYLFLKRENSNNVFLFFYISSLIQSTMH